jgi:hypothetical protein
MSAASAAAAVTPKLAAAALAMIVLAACGSSDGDEPRKPRVKQGSPEALAAYLDEVAAYPPAARAEVMRGWQLPPAAWNRIVVPPFRDAYADYLQRYDAAVAAIDKQLTPGTYTARRHYAGDVAETPDELVLRWTVPVLYPSVVADRDGKPVNAVFLWDDNGWRTLAGLDRTIFDRCAALDTPAIRCTEFLQAVAIKECSDVDYLVADAAIRSDRAAFTRACSFAAVRCGKRSAP